MTDRAELTDDQNDRIDATLKRIRAGLKRGVPSPDEEPAHIFKPEAVNEKK
ncbi:hypothetical protein [Pelagibius sp. Alg239-R121]|uniref:hypothetical protein n=1 Tax=Pelagibius sp. Alg239-R121 TaxID=2993448 RepID=UPI0024A790D3|nr:hypothetical protein [Pelagibius sp. Alg239-R121]